MDLLIIDKKGASPNSKGMEIPEIQKVWKRDRSEKKEFAKKELLFIYYSIDHKSPYFELLPKQREQEIIKDLFKDGYWQPDKEVRLASEKYRDLQILEMLERLEEKENEPVSDR